MALVYKELNETKKSCAQLSEIYIEAPKWPNLDSMLEACGDTNKITKKLDTKRKNSLLSSKIGAPKKASPMNLKDESGNSKSIALSNYWQKNRYRIFCYMVSTLPKKRCRDSLEFYNTLQLSPQKNKIELLAIRASTARETQSFADFKKQYNIPFPIMTDEGIAFESFANEQGVSPGFPMLAITNTKERSYTFSPHGDYNDTSKELFWLLESL